MPHPYAKRPSFANIDAAQFGFGHGRPVSDDVRFYLNNYVNSLDFDHAQVGDVWAPFYERCADAYGILASSDPSSINQLVSVLFASPLTHGFLQGDLAHTKLRDSKDSRAMAGAIALDRFFRLAEAVGATQVHSLEHGQWEIYIQDLDGILSRIEDKIGSNLPTPDQDGEMFGLLLRGCIYTDRHFDGIYAAWRLRELGRLYEIESARICEIGGGAGLVAFYARHLGCRSYTIIDLPQALIVQYLVLASAYTNGVVSLINPVKSGIWLTQAGTPEALEAQLNSDIVFNMDSLPEMPALVSEKYLSNLRPHQLLLSINQESGVLVGDEHQSVVRYIADRIGLKQTSRYPSWLRTGYVEEIITHPEYKDPLSRIVELRQKHEDALRHITDLSQKYKDALNHITELSQKLSTLQTSYSWRYTSPLRWLGRLFRKVL